MSTGQSISLYSDESEQEYIVEALSDELITSLQKIEGLQVISPHSVMRFKDSDETPDLPEVSKISKAGSRLFLL